MLQTRILRYAQKQDPNTQQINKEETPIQHQFLLTVQTQKKKSKGDLSL